MPTYRSQVAITNQTRKLAAYERLALLLQHLPVLGVDLTRVELMGDSFIEVDLTGSLSVPQRDHLGLQGPV